MSQDTVHQLTVDKEIYKRWCWVGASQGFNTDSQIASFLLLFYEKNHAEKEESGMCCINCQRVLPRVCNACSPTQQAGDDGTTQSQFTGQQQQKSLSSMEAKKEESESNSRYSDSWLLEASSSSLIHGPNGSVFRDAGKVVSVRNLVHSDQDQLLFTNLYPVTKNEIQAGKFSLLSSSKQHRQTAQATETQNQGLDQTDRQTLLSPTDSDQVSHFITSVKMTGESYPVRIFQIDDVNKVAVNALFTNCERETCLLPQPARKEDAEVRASVQTVETCDKDADCEDTVVEEEEEDRTADGSSGEGEQETKPSPDIALALPSDLHSRRRAFGTARKSWGRPPYLCQKCGASFKSTSTLSRHILKHTGERPFPCPECKFAFATRPELRVHFRKHTGEKPFLCPICGSAHDRSSNLHAHMRTHTGERPFKCDHCGGCYTTSSSLNRHKRIHTGEKPYVCSQCSAAFPQLEHLKEHQLRHSGVKPYQCQKCDAAFSNMSRLRRHQRKVQCSKR